MRFRSTSIEQNSNSISISNRELQEQIDLNYIGLRQNKNHVQCHSHQQSLGLPPKANIMTGLEKINFQLLVNNINDELQRLIDTELKGALENMKNDLQNQQFGFERQMCQVIGKMQSDLQNAGIARSGPQTDMSDYALQKDLKELELFVIKIAEQIEENMNAFQLQQNNFINAQNETINQNNEKFRNKIKMIEAELANQKEQNKQFQDSIIQCENRFIQNDQKFESQQILIDKNYDDLEQQLRELRENVRKEILKIENMYTDMDEKNEFEHSQFRQQLQMIEQNLGNQDISDKLKELEILINIQDSSNIVNNLVKRVETLEQQNNNFLSKIETLEENLIQRLEALEQNRGQIQQMETLREEYEEIQTRIETVEKKRKNQKEEVKTSQGRLETRLETLELHSNNEKGIIEKIREGLQSRLETLEKDRESNREKNKEGVITADEGVLERLEALEQNREVVKEIQNVFQTRLETLEKDRDVVKTIQDDFQQRLEALEIDKDKYKEEIKSLQDELQAKIGVLEETREKDREAEKKIHEEFQQRLEILEQIIEKETQIVKTIHLEHRTGLETVEKEREVIKKSQDRFEARLETLEKDRVIKREEINIPHDGEFEIRLRILEQNRENDREEAINNHQGLSTRLEVLEKDIQKYKETVKTIHLDHQKRLEILEQHRKEDKEVVNRIQDQVNEMQNIANDVETLKYQVNEMQNIANDVEKLKQQVNESDESIKSIQLKMKEIDKLKSQVHDYDVKQLNDMLLEHHSDIALLKNMQEQAKKRDQTELNKNYFMSELEEMKTNISNLNLINQSSNGLEQDLHKLKQKVQELTNEIELLHNSDRQNKQDIIQMSNSLEELSNNFNQFNETIINDLNRKADKGETKALSNSIKDLQKLIEHLQNELKTCKDQLQDFYINDLNTQLQKHQEQISKLLKMKTEVEHSNVSEVDSKQFEIIINQFRININAELDQIREDIEKLKKWTEQNVTRIDKKDKEQDERLDKLELSLSTIDAKIQEGQKAILIEIHKMMKELQERHKQDVEHLEHACFNTLPSEILKQVQDNVQQYTYNPLLKRIENIEAQLEMRRNQQTPEKVVDRQQLLQDQHELMHQRLLSEMKKRKLWYLRKTPQDHVIEEIMLQRRCTQEHAEQIYMQQLEKKHVLRDDNESQKLTKEGAVLKSRHDNIIHVTSVDVQGGETSRSRSCSRQYNENPLLRGSYMNNQSQVSHRSFSPREVMRTPVDPETHQELEAAYEEASSILGPTPNKNPSRAPYIVIHSPMHESERKVVVGSTQYSGGCRPYDQQYNQYNLPRVHHLGEQRTLHYQVDDEEVDESNVDLLDLEEVNFQMRDNFSRMEQERDGYFERPISNAFQNTNDKESRLSEVSNQVHTERMAILKSLPHSLNQSNFSFPKLIANIGAQKNITVRTNKDSNYEIKEVVENWDDEEDSKVHKEDELDQLQYIEEVQEPIDVTYESSLKYNQRERAQYQFENQNKKNQQQENEDDNQSFGDVKDLL